MPPHPALSGEFSTADPWRRMKLVYLLDLPGRGHEVLSSQQKGMEHRQKAQPEGPPVEICIAGSKMWEEAGQRADGEIRGCRFPSGMKVARLVTVFIWGSQCFLVHRIVGGVWIRFWNDSCLEGWALGHSPSLRRLSVWAQPRDSPVLPRYFRVYLTMPSAVSSVPRPPPSL